MKVRVGPSSRRLQKTLLTTLLVFDALLGLLTLGNRYKSCLVFVIQIVYAIVNEPWNQHTHTLEAKAEETESKGRADDAPSEKKKKVCTENKNTKINRPLD